MGFQADRTIEDVKKKMASGEKVIVSKIMRENGYSDSSANSMKITQTDKWKTFLDTIRDDEILGRIEDFALNDDDKRLALDSAKEVFKLRNRYPTNKEETVTPQLNIVVNDVKEITTSESVAKPIQINPTSVDDKPQSTSQDGGVERDS